MKLAAPLTALLFFFLAATPLGACPQPGQSKAEDLERFGRIEDLIKQAKGEWKTQAECAGCKDSQGPGECPELVSRAKQLATGLHSGQGPDRADHLLRYAQFVRTHGDRIPKAAEDLLRQSLASKQPYIVRACGAFAIGHFSNADAYEKELLRILLTSTKLVSRAEKDESKILDVVIAGRTVVQWLNTGAPPRGNKDELQQFMDELTALKDLLEGKVEAGSLFRSSLWTVGKIPGKEALAALRKAGKVALSPDDLKAYLEVVRERDSVELWKSTIYLLRDYQNNLDKLLKSSRKLMKKKKSPKPPKGWKDGQMAWAARCEETRLHGVSHLVDKGAEWGERVRSVHLALTSYAKSIELAPPSTEDTLPFAAWNAWGKTAFKPVEPASQE